MKHSSFAIGCANLTYNNESGEEWSSDRERKKKIHDFFLVLIPLVLSSGFFSLSLSLSSLSYYLIHCFFSMEEAKSKLLHQTYINRDFRVNFNVLAENKYKTHTVISGLEATFPCLAKIFREDDKIVHP